MGNLFSVYIAIYPLDVVLDLSIRQDHQGHLGLHLPEDGDGQSRMSLGLDMGDHQGGRGDHQSHQGGHQGGHLEGHRGDHQEDPAGDH